MLHVFSPDGGHRLKVRGPLWQHGCCQDIAYHVTNASGAAVATITKLWIGLCAETLTTADNFVIDFHDAGMDVGDKALVLAASFLIDLMYYKAEM